MNAFGAGAHEAGHLIENRLAQAYGIPAREIIAAAYGLSARAVGFKPLKVFMQEVSTHAFKKGYSECLADAVADCLVNGENAAHLSKSVLQILKGEAKMVAYSELQLSKFSVEEFEKYAVFDELGGEAIGFKDDAPEEFKKAWLADKKLYDDARAKGIVL